MAAETPARELAELGGGGADTPGGDGDDGVIDPGGGDPDGEPVGVVAAAPVTLMERTWPRLQCPGTAQM